MKIYKKILSGQEINLSVSGPFSCDCKIYETRFGKVLFTSFQDAVLSLEFVTESVEKSLAHIAKRFPKATFTFSNKTDPIWENFQKNKDVPLILYGTPFCIEVWQALLKIPRGKLVSYQRISEMVQKPSATRAVGRAIGSNPIAWIVPCHRVIRKDGNISGFFYGIELKKQLIEFEKTMLETKEVQ